MLAPSLKERALRLLARREHSRAELAQKLALHAEAGDVTQVLARLTELGLVDDLRYAKAWVRSKAPRFGIARLRYELTRSGVAAEAITEALHTEIQGSELERAGAIWRRRYEAPAPDVRGQTRQMRFLQGRGFSSEVISQLFNEGRDESA